MITFMLKTQDFKLSDFSGKSSKIIIIVSHATDAIIAQWCQPSLVVVSDEA